MGLGLLPLEKIPLFIWGAVLCLGGVYLLIQSQSLFFEDWKWLLMTIVGGAITGYDVRSRLRRRRGEESESGG